MHLIDEIAKVTTRLLIKEPFYGHFFVNILKEEEQKSDNIYVVIDGSFIVIKVSENYWNNTLCTDDLKYGAIKHQILHIVFRHILKTKDFGNRKFFDIACDLVVNQYIEKHQLTENAITLNSFPELDLSPHMPLEYYYAQLVEKQDNMGNGERSPEISDIDGDQSDQHQKWNTPSDATFKVLEDEVNHLIRKIAEKTNSREFGNLPAGIQEQLKKVMESLKPSMNWRRTLRLFNCSSSKTYIKSTIHRVSKRYGTTPGIKIKRKNHLLVALDTSGSLNNEDLALFFGEMHHIYKQGTQITVVECDTVIHRQYEYMGIPPENIRGRGGTDFNEPIERANKLRVDGLIYFTDGYAEIPEAKCNCPVFWLLAPNSQKNDELPGRVVMMNR